MNNGKCSCGGAWASYTDLPMQIVQFFIGKVANCYPLLKSLIETEYNYHATITDEQTFLLNCPKLAFMKL